MLPEISNEQLDVLNNLKDYNVVVDSVAGSGKTTCILHIAKHFEDKYICLLTYNAKLKIETREKAAALEIANMEINSYHSFCCSYYDRTANTDKPIVNLIKNKTPPLKKFKYDMIILDEAQDITPLFYELILKITTDNNNDQLKICILGDRNQSIYDFNGSDKRFIIYAADLFNVNKLEWKFCNLSTSYRITDSMAKFVNNCVLKSDRLKANKTSKHKPRYVICDCFKTATTLKEVKYYLKLGYKAQDIFILAPSLKSLNSPVRKLENAIKIKCPEINVYVPASDEEKLDSDILENKIVFSTFHQVKGLERKVVIVFGFDNSYFKFFKKNLNDQSCPNEIYVAITRALEHLSVFHHCGNEHFKFIDPKMLSTETKLVNQKKIKLTNTNNDNNLKTSVSDLCKHLSDDVIDNCLNFLTITQLSKPESLIEIESKIKQTHGFESVSEITGTVIPLYYEQLLRDGSENISIKDLMIKANVNCSERSGFIFKTLQIDNYDWLSKDILDRCMERIAKLKISKNAKFEEEYKIENKEELMNRKIIGYVDCLDANNIYEFKCTSKLNSDHLLQLGIYMYLYETHKGELVSSTDSPINTQTNYYLFNILSGELIKIESDYDKLKNMMKYLIENKYFNQDYVSDNVFIDNMFVIKNRY